MTALAQELEQELLRLKSGEHICQIYETSVERLTATVAFLKEGLARQQRCSYVADPQMLKETKDALTTVGVAAEHHCRRGALQFLGKESAHLAGGSFEPQTMLRILHHETDQALIAGFSGFWFAGDMSWTHESNTECARVIKCEALLNSQDGNRLATILCQYEATQFDPTCLHDVLRTHPMVIIGKQVCANPYYEPPDLVRDLPAPSDDSMSRRVEWWINQLKRVRNTERDRERLIQQLQGVRDELREHEELLRKIFDHLPITLSFFDEQGRLSLVNREWERTFGWTLQEIEEPSRDILVDSFPDPQERERARQALEAGTGEWAIYRIRTREGQSIDVWGAVLRLSDGSRIGIAQDLTERVRAQQELEAANQRVLQVEVEQKRFYREVLRAVTHNKFHLVDVIAIPTLGQLVLETGLDDPSSHALLRRQLREIEEGVGMAPEVGEDFVLAVSEATANAVKHAAHGQCSVYRDEERLLVRVSDRGSGIKSEDLPGSILIPGFSTQVSLGMGYTLMLSLADCIWLATGPEGTVVQLAKWIHPEDHPQTLLSGVLDRL